MNDANFIEWYLHAAGYILGLDLILQALAHHYKVAKNKMDAKRILLIVIRCLFWPIYLAGVIISLLIVKAFEILDKDE